MSDQGDAGTWRPASHNGPYSEPDEPTGPLPPVGRDDETPPAFPPMGAASEQRRPAHDEPPGGGFPGVSATGEAPRPQRERAPFEPAEPAGPAAQPWGAGTRPSSPGGPSPAPAGGRTADLSFPSPGSDEAGAGSTPPFGVSAFPPEGAGHGPAADDAGPSQGPGTPSDAEKPYGFGTPAGPASAYGTGSGGAEASPARPAAPEPDDAPPAWSPGAWAEQPSADEQAGASPSAWNEAPGTDGWAASSSSGPGMPPPPAGPSGLNEPSGTSPSAPGGRAETPAFGSGTWNEPSSEAPDAPAGTPPPAAGGRHEAWPPGPEERADTPAFGAAAWDETPPGTGGHEQAWSSGPQERADTPAFGAAAWGETPPGADRGEPTWSSAPEEPADAPAPGAGAWGEASPSGPGRADDAPASRTGAWSDDTPASGVGAWSDASSSGTEGGRETWSSGSDERGDTPAFGAAWGESPASGTDGHAERGEQAGAATGGWNDTSAFGAGAWGESPVSGTDEPGASSESLSAAGPETWTDTPASSASGRHRAGPPDLTPPAGADIPPVDPYDARDSRHGYEVSDPSFGLGMPSPGAAGRRAAPDEGVASGRDVPDVSSAWETPAYGGARDAADRPGGANEAASRGMPLDDPAPPRPFGAPGESFAGERFGGGFGGEPAGGGLSGGDVPPGGGAHRSSTDHDADHEFFGPTDDPATWGSVGAPSGPPPQPGKPSSGNLRLPEWMREEGGRAAPAPTAESGDTAGSGGHDYGYEDDEGRSRLPLIAGLGVLVAGLVVAAGVYLLKGGGDDRPSPAAHVTTAPNRGGGPAAPKSAGASAQQKALPTFNGPHTRAVGRIVDQRAALSYPRLGRPWQMEPKGGQMAQLGFSAGQYAVTEKAGGQAKLWARLMSGPLGGADKGAYQGPETVQAAATQVAATYEAKLYGFKHHTKPIASQPLVVSGHAGWLVAYHLTYHRAATRATGELFTVAVVDTGKQAPGVLLMSVPDTERGLDPDLNYVVNSLKTR